VPKKERRKEGKKEGRKKGRNGKIGRKEGRKAEVYQRWKKERKTGIKGRHRSRQEERVRRNERRM
jgi:hypothetical protein